MKMRGMVLVDTMVAIFLIGVMVLLLGVFVREGWEFSLTVKRSQQLRQETFALVQNVLPSLLREASAIDYAHSSEQELVLYLDKWTRDRVLRVFWDQVDERSRLVLEKDGEEQPLTSDQIFLTDLEFRYSTDPTSSAEEFSRLRTFQPMVSVRVGARHRDAEKPLLTYQSSFTLRNATFSTLPE